MQQEQHAAALSAVRKTYDEPEGNFGDPASPAIRSSGLA
jgi:hypothetical protein